MSAVTVIIVNWNGGDTLRQCVTDLLRQTLQPERILVMDNGSTDSSAEKISALPGVEMRMLGSNLGFAAGNNLALYECNTEFIALLNPDAFPEPDWLEKLVAAASVYKDVVAFGSRQLVAGMERVVDGLGDEYHLSGLIWRKGYGRSIGAGDLTPCEIFSPCAGAALYRRTIFIEVGGFDEDFFCYAEDVDIGFRLRLAGYRSFFVPDAVVHHVGSATTGGQHSDFSVYHGHRNLVWTYVKNMPGWLFWACLPAHLLMNLVTMVVFLWRGKGKLILSAKLDAVKGIPKMWRKRRYIQRHRVASIAEIWRVLDKRILTGRRAR